MIPFVDAAHSALPGPEREVLALLRESGLGYDGIGELLCLDRVGVAEIAARARLRLAGAVPADACRPQLAHLAAAIDGEAVASPDPRHLETCAACPGTLEAMRAADAAYRAWQPGAMPEELRERIRGRR